MKKRVLIIGVCSLVVLFGCAFAKSSEKDLNFQSENSALKETNVIPVSSSFMIDSSKDTSCNVALKIDSDNGDILISVDGGNTWITKKEYEKNYPDYPEIQTGNTSNFSYLSDDDNNGSGFFFDNNVMTKINPDNDNVLVSIDRGKTWLTIAEYEKQYPDYPEIPYKNAEDFQNWINENIKKVQDGYWEKTGGKGWLW